MIDPTALLQLLASCRPFHALVIILPLLCVTSLCRSLPKRGALWCIITGLCLYETLLFLMALVLGNFSFLDKQYYRAVYIGVTALLTILSIPSLPHIARALFSIRYRPQWIDLVIVGCVVNALRLLHVSLILDWTFGTSSFDSLNYHIPRALMWSWQGSLAPYPTNIWQQLGHAYGGAATVLPNTFLGCGWLGGSFATMVFSFGASAAVMMMGIKAGLSTRASLIGALVFIFCPLVGFRLVDTSTDMAAAFPVLAVMAMSWRSPRLRESLFLYPALVALGVSVKQYVLFPAIPVALFIFGPQLKRIITDPKSIVSGLLGVGAGLVFIALSFLPIKAALGDFTGGGLATTLSNFGLGWKAVWDSLVLVTLEWSLEFIRGFSEPTRKYLYLDLGLNRVFAFFGFNFYRGLLDSMNKEQMRGGFFSLLFLPWLILSIPKGWRLRALIVFVAVYVTQFAPLAINGVGARFAIIPVAFFCVLWSFRAEKSMPLSSMILLVLSFLFVRIATPGGVMEYWLPFYFWDNEVNKSLASIVKDDKVMLLGRSLSQDASIAGRLGQVRFEYFACPADGDWVRYFKEMKKQSKWIVFYLPEGSFIPGPNFQTALGPNCPRIPSDQFKADLQTAGWSFHSGVVRDYELWGYSE
jgi:hypothetical protein